MSAVTQMMVDLRSMMGQVLQIMFTWWGLCLPFVWFVIDRFVKYIRKLY